MILTRKTEMQTPVRVVLGQSSLFYCIQNISQNIEIISFLDNLSEFIFEQNVSHFSPHFLMMIEMILINSRIDFTKDQDMYYE